MTIAFYQAATALDTSGTSISFGAITVQSGDFLVAGIMIGNANVSPTISDNNGGVWNVAIKNDNDNNGNSQYVWYSMNHPSGSTTVTIGVSTSSSIRGSLFEFSGVAATNALDQTKEGQGTSTTPSSGNITTTQPSELVVCFTQGGAGETFTAGSFNGYNFAAPTGATSSKSLMEYAILNQQQTGAGACTMSGSTGWDCMVASFLSAAPTNYNYLTSAGVQQFSITIASGNLTGTATITAVGNGAFISYGGVNPSVTTDAAEALAYLTLTNSTTITATRNTSTTGTVVITGSITDGNLTNLIKSVQYGTATIASAASTGTASISSVTNANAATHLLGLAPNTSTLSIPNDFAYVTLSSTTLTATRPGNTTGDSMVVGFCVIEFQGSALTANVVQNVLATTTGTVTSFTGTITAVVLTNAVTFYGGCTLSLASTDLAESKMRGALSATTTLTVTINTSVASDAKSYAASVVEFISAALGTPIQRGTTTLTAATSATSSITSSNVTLSAVSWLGNTTTATSAVLNEAEGNVVLTNATTITVAKNSATANITGSWEVFQPWYVAPLTWLPDYEIDATINLVPSGYSYIAPILSPPPAPSPFINWRAEFPFQVQPAPPPAYNYFSNSPPDEVLHLPVPFLPRLPDVAPPVLIPGYSDFASPIFPLNFKLPWLPRLPDISSVVPPLSQGSVAMNAQPLNFILRWLPRIGDAPPVIPPDKPNFFSHIFPLNFTLPWLPTRVADAPPIIPPDKPSFFAPRWLLNLPIPWLPVRVADAALAAQADKPNFFSPIFSTAATTILSWFPRVADAPAPAQADRPNFFSPLFPLNFRLPWLPKISDASPLALSDKPTVFSPSWPLNFLLRWLPETRIAAPPSLPPAQAITASPIFPLNFLLPWLSKSTDAPPITPPDRPNYFAPRWLLNLPLPWLPKISEAPSSAIADKPNFFAPIQGAIAAALSWLPRISDAAPKTEAHKQSIFSPLFSFISYIPWLPWVSHAEPPSRLPPESIVILPEPDVAFGDIGKLLRLRHRNRNLPIDFKNDIVAPLQRDVTLDISPETTSISPRHKNRIV